MSIHGSFTTLSPPKKGKNSHYFDGIMTVGTSFLRIVGLSSEQQKKLSASFESGQPAHIANCEEKSRQGNKLVVMLKRFTNIQKSPKKTTTPPDDGLSEDSAVYITLGELNKVDEFH